MFTSPKKQLSLEHLLLEVKLLVSDYGTIVNFEPCFSYRNINKSEKIENQFLLQNKSS